MRARFAFTHGEEAASGASRTIWSTRSLAEGLDPCGRGPSAVRNTRESAESINAVSQKDKVKPLVPSWDADHPIAEHA